MLTPKQQKEIADAFGFSNFEAFKTYVEKAMSLGMSYDEVIKELETTPRIGPQKGKFVPIPKKVLDAALMPDITGGIAPPERKQWGEAELARLQRKATGKELSGMEKVQAAYNIFENLLTMAAGARGAKKLGTQKGRMAFHGGKKPTALRKAAELSVASKKPLAIGTGPKLKELPPGVESNVPFGRDTTIYNKIQKVVAGQIVEIAPIEILKHYYQETRNLPDAEAAQILGEKINRFRNENEKIKLSDLSTPVRVKQKRYFGRGMHGEFEPSTGEIKLDSGKPTRDRVETLLHELTHAYDIENIVRMRQESGRFLEELKKDEQKEEDFKLDPYYNFGKTLKENVELLTQPQSVLQQTPVVRGYGGDFQKYALSSLEVGPNLWGPARRYAERMGYSLQTRRDIPEFIRQLREDPAKKEDFLRFINETRGLKPVSKNPEKRQREIELIEKSNEELLDRIEFDKETQLEWLKWVKAPEQKQTEAA